MRRKIIMKNAISLIFIIFYTSTTLVASGLICFNCIITDNCCNAQEEYHIKNISSNCCKKEVKRCNQDITFEDCRCGNNISSTTGILSKINLELNYDLLNKYINKLFVLHNNLNYKNLKLVNIDIHSKNLSKLHLKQSTHISINSFLI